MNVSLHLTKFGSMDEQKSEFSVSMNLFLSWRDDRLSLEDRTRHYSSLVLSQQMLQRIWRPSLHFSNTPELLANASGSSASTAPYLGVIYGDGRVQVRKSITIVSTCKLNFVLYPMDVHRCSLQLESSQLPVQSLRLQWSLVDALVIADDLSWVNFDLLEARAHHSVIEYPVGGQYSRLETIFSLQRKSGYFLYTLYLPSSLIVVSSWSNLWIDIPAAPARTMLTMSTMLAHITNSKSVHDSLPRVSYIHSLDVWTIMCTRKLT